MPELIDRLETIQSIKNTFCSECDCEYGDESCKVCEYDFCIGILNEQPTIEPEVRHGRWIPYDVDCRGYTNQWCCTNCKTYSYTSTYQKECEFEYCPNCGARMDLRTPTEVQLDEADSVMMGGADNGNG